MRLPLRLNSFEPGHCATALRKSFMIFVMTGFLVSTTVCQCSNGQEPGNGQSQNSLEIDNDAEDLHAANSSLDETINNKEDLAKEEQMRDRLMRFGVIGGGFLALMGVLFAYLRLHHATRGFHAGRLQMLAVFISILILATCYFLWTQVLFK